VILITGRQHSSAMQALY